MSDGVSLPPLYPNAHPVWSDLETFPPADKADAAAHAALASLATDGTANVIERAITDHHDGSYTVMAWQADANGRSQDKQVGIPISRAEIDETLRNHPRAHPAALWVVLAEAATEKSQRLQAAAGHAAPDSPHAGTDRTLFALAHLSQARSKTLPTSAPYAEVSSKIKDAVSHLRPVTLVAPAADGSMQLRRYSVLGAALSADGKKTTLQLFDPMNPGPHGTLRHVDLQSLLDQNAVVIIHDTVGVQRSIGTLSRDQL